MKRRKKILAYALTAALVTGTVPVEASAAAKPVKPVKSSVTLKITNQGGKTTYGSKKITLKRVKGVKIKSTKYKLSNKKIAKVNKKGVVTAKKAGSAKLKITVTYIQKKKTHKEKLTVKIRVKNVSVPSASAPQASAPQASSAATAGSVSTAPGSTENPAGVSSAAPSASAAPETSQEPSPEGLRFIRKNYVTYVGGSTAITPVYSDEEEDLPMLDYVSADKEIATVNEYGMVQGIKEGSTTITVRMADGSDSETIGLKVLASRELAEYADDFYDAANAPIIQDATNEGIDRWSAFQEMADTVEDRELEIVENAIDGDQDYEAGSAQAQLAAFYLTADDVEAREENGIGSLKEYVDMIDGADSIEGLLDVEAMLDKKGIAGIFNTSVTFTEEDRTQKVFFELSDYALSDYALPDEEFPGDDDDFEEMDSEEILEQYADSLLCAAGEDDSVRSDNIKALKEIFRKFAVSYDSFFGMLDEIPDDVSEDELGDIFDDWDFDLNKEYSAQEIEELMENCDLLSYLQKAGYDTADSIVVQVPSQMSQIDSCLTQDNLAALKEYAKYELLNQYAKYMTEEIYENYSLLYEAENWEPMADYEDSVFAGAMEQLEWEVCYLYTQEYETPERKQAVTDMVDAIVERYSAQIDACSWMSDSTKENARKKLDTMGKNILYPDDYERYLLESDLVMPEDGGNLIDNVRMIDEEYAQAERAAVGSEITNHDWIISPLTTNACYVPQLNGMYICSGVMGDLMYDSERSDAMNYGALGMIIAHEISHAFDTTGALYDEQGNQSNWWTEEDTEHYEKIQQQLIDFYNTYYVMDLDGEPIFQDGWMTLSENIADLAGVNCVVDLIGDSRKERQDFFTGFANLWAEVGTLTEDDLFDILFDEHSIAKVRVNAVLSMLDEFYETYDIKAGDAMYVAPEDRISIW